jgi:hypothetical protein
MPALKDCVVVVAAAMGENLMMKEQASDSR